MSTIPSALQEHLDGGAATVCILLKIIPVRPGYAAFGVTDLDRNTVYDDGAGELTYYASIGADISAWQTKNNMDVDNAETTGLMPMFDIPLSIADFRGGVYDYARFEARLVNYEDLTMGAALLHTGNLGRISIKNDMVWVSELLGLTAKLQRNFVRRATRTCGAIFGSQPIGTSGDVVTERYPCGKDISSSWVTGEVTGLGEDSQYQIETDLGAADATYKPGALRWLDGPMAGRTYEVEDFVGGEVTFTFPLDFVPEVGNTFEIRADCTKQVEGGNGCKFHFGTDWVLHFRGFPHIPNGEQDRLNSPGASG